MKTIKLEFAYDHFSSIYPSAILTNPPSRSFVKQARIALTELLFELIEDPFSRAHLVDDFEVTVDWSLLSRQPKKRRLLPLKLEPKSAPYILLSFCLWWEYCEPGREEIPVPWLDFADGELQFHIIADPVDVRNMNADIPESITPVVRKEESGLPYDYLIQTNDGTVRIFFRNAVTEKRVQTVADILNRFFTEYNETHEDKIHSIGSPQKRGEKVVMFDADFGGAPIDALVRMVHTFEKVEGIRKVTVQ